MVVRLGFIPGPRIYRPHLLGWVEIISRCGNHGIDAVGRFPARQFPMDYRCVRTTCHFRHGPTPASPTNRMLLFSFIRMFLLSCYQQIPFPHTCPCRPMGESRRILYIWPNTSRPILAWASIRFN